MYYARVTSIVLYYSYYNIRRFAYLISDDVELSSADFLLILFAILL